MRKQFKYDRVFASGSTQEEVYEDTKALIRSVLDGERCSLLCYAMQGGPIALNAEQSFCARPIT